MASSLPEELVQEILVRLPPDEPVHLARASLVCKAWRRVLSNRGCFWRRCREFHGAPPLLGYIRNRYDDRKPMRFVRTTTSIASPARMPAVDYSRWFALDCRHGRVLIHADAKVPSKRLIVWDAITGSQQHLIAPSYHFCSYTGAVLCAKDSCDHLDCHGGPFRVVIVETNRIRPVFAFVSIYSSVTGSWSALTSIEVKHRSNIYRIGGSNNTHSSLLIGDTLYFPIEDGTIILKYDVCTHSLSQIDMPRDVFNKGILMKAEDGGLRFATLLDNHIYLCSRQEVTNGPGWWGVHRVMDLGTLFPTCRPYNSYEVIGFAEGTNTIFIDIDTEIFTLDLESKKVRKVGVRRSDRFDAILPYMSFYTSRI